MNTKNLDFSYTHFALIIILLPFYSKAQNFTITPTNSVCSPECYEYEFSATLPSTYLGSDIRYFWNFGDGTYGTGNPVTHIYNSNMVVTPYLEVTSAYEEEDPPPESIFQGGGTIPVDFTPACNNCGPISLIYNNTNPVTLSSNRTPVPQNLITYIISCNNPCEAREDTVTANVTFTFPDKLMADPNPDFVGHLPPENSSSANTLNWNLRILPGRTKNIFVRMKVKEDSIGIPIKCDLNVDYTKGCFGETGNSFVISDEQLTDKSHDPNDLIGDQDSVCFNQIQSLKYRIRFQNEGTGVADSVIIKMVIPYDFDLSSIQTVYPNSSLSPHSTATPGELRWVLKGNNLKGLDSLRGTAEPDFGNTFFYDATEDSLVFTINLKNNGTDQQHCEAIIGEAEIIFDCNPSIFTNPFVTKIGCKDVGSDPGFPIGCSICDGNLITLDTISIIDSATLLFDSSIIPNIGNVTAKWYPATGLDDPFALNPIAKPDRTTIYHLVAYRKTGCERTIVKYPVEVPCNLEITSQLHCDASGKKYYTATVNSDSPHLKWYDGRTCSYGKTFESEHGNWGNDFHLSVTDTISRCYTEKIIMIADYGCSRGGVQDRVLAVLVLLGLIGIIYLIRRFFQ